MIGILVVFHIVAGSVAIAGMVGALCTRKGQIWHRRFGKLYIYAMAVALLLAFVVSAMSENLFLLCIAVFSTYLIYTGWRLAIIKTGVQNTLDEWVISVMLIVGVVMIGFGGYMSAIGNSLGIALMVFGVLGFIPAWSDLKRQGTWPKGKERIMAHLSRMGGGCIATTTAVFVTIVQTSPAFIAWILPSAVGSVLITYWSRRVLSNRPI